jgi:hypothetical protein
MQVFYINESSHIVELALSAKDIATLEVWRFYYYYYVTLRCER